MSSLTEQQLKALEDVKLIENLAKDDKLVLFNHIKENKKDFKELVDKLELTDEKIEEIRLEISKSFEDKVEEVKQAIEDIELLEPENGIDGKDGYNPIKGIDYFTEQEIDEIKQEVKPIKGIDYKDGKDADEDLIIEKVIEKIPIPENGKDGSPDTPEMIKEKLESLEGKYRLDASAIKNLPIQEIRDITKIGYSGLQNILDNGAKVTNSIKTLDFTGFNLTKVNDKKVIVDIDSILAKYLKLDQSTPQTLINGIPLLEATRTIDSDNQLVDKKYVDDAIGIENLWDRTGTTLTTHFADDDVNIGGDITANNLTGTNTGDQDLSGYIPYTGATSDVNLGSKDLTATDIIATGNISGSNLSGTNTGDQDLSGYVPYTGANANVDLGDYELTASKLNIVGSVSEGQPTGIQISNSSSINNPNGWKIVEGYAGNYDGYLMIIKNGNSTPGNFGITPSGGVLMPTGALIGDNYTIGSLTSGALAYYKPYNGVNRGEIFFRGGNDGTDAKFKFRAYYKTASWNLTDVMELSAGSLGNIVDINGEITKGKENSKVQGVLFTQTADKTIANTTTETTLIGTGVGTTTLPANTLVAGRTIRIKLKGYLSGTNGHNATVKIKLGSVELVTSLGTMPETLTNRYFEVEFDLTCRTTGTTGTVIGQGSTMIMAGVGLTTSYTRPLQMTSTATINTTTSQTLGVTYTWGTASTNNTITSTNLSIEVLN